MQKLLLREGNILIIILNMSGNSICMELSFGNSGSENYLGYAESFVEYSYEIFR